jgi:SAM-dependent MidA family methyltransferase
MPASKDKPTYNAKDKPAADLVAVIAAEIQAAGQQRITFARFMELALYQPQLGYYATQAQEMGAAGDFFTSAHLGADFGELLAEQFVDIWQILGKPIPFTLVEMGAGQGLMAADILAYLQNQHPDCFASLTYWIIEKVPELMLCQQQQLQPWRERVTWTTLADIPTAGVTGCFFSNELVDALPVHQVVVTSDPESARQLQEVYVQVAPETEASGTPEFQEILGPLSTPSLTAYFQTVGIDLLAPNYPVGYRTEANLCAQDWLHEVARGLNQGYLITIDYGYAASHYYSPARVQGTLQCYRQHGATSDPYRQVGLQDITAHVDFTSLQQQGQQAGLVTLGMTSQAVFLMSLGLGDRLSPNLLGGDFTTVMKRRDALHQLMHPHGLGGFKVLIQSKNLTAEMQKNTLRGLQGEIGIELLPS